LQLLPLLHAHFGENLHLFFSGQTFDEPLPAEIAEACKKPLFLPFAQILEKRRPVGVGDILEKEPLLLRAKGLE